MSAKGSKTSMKNKCDDIRTEIVIRNEKILKFCNDNKTIDIEKVLLLLIDLLDNTLSISSNTPMVLHEVLQSIKVQNNEIENMMLMMKTNTELHKSDVENLKMMISSSNNTLTTKLFETKDNYIREVKELMKYKDMDSMMNISGTIEKQNNVMIDKVNLILNDALPKSLSMQSNEIIGFFKDDMTKSLNKLLENDPSYSTDKIINVIESKYNNLTSSIQEQIINSINLTENRLSNNISQIKEISTKSTVIQEKINDELVEYLNKAKSIQYKGAMGENRLYNILNEEYLTSEIIKTTGQTAMGDIVLKRPNKHPILFETKHHNNNVMREEVEKFIRDITTTGYHGIFLSQNTGIVGKNNFQIDFHDNNVLIYIHRANYDITKIISAINIIDIITDKILNVKNNNILMNSDLLKTINDDFQRFLDHRENTINHIKESNKKTMEMMGDFNIPSIDKWLAEYYANSRKNIIICDNCKIYSSDKKTSMARHLRFCKSKTTDNKSDTDSDTKNKKQVIVI